MNTSKRCSAVLKPIQSEILDLLNNLKLDYIDSQWIESANSKDYIGISELPAEYEEIYMNINNKVELMQIICQKIRSAIQKEDLDWQFLVEQNVAHPALLALLSHLLHNGIAFKDNDAHVIYAFVAASFYTLLVVIPGSNPYRIFHENLYEMCVSMLDNVSRIDNASHGNKNTNSRRSEDFSDPRIKMNVAHQLVLDHLTLVKRYSLKDRDEMIQHVILNAVALIRLETINDLSGPPTRTSPSLTTIAWNAYEILRSLVVEQHGDVGYLFEIVTKHFLPIFIQDSKLNLNAKEFTIVSGHASRFIQSMVLNVGEESHMGARILVHQACVHTPDRSDPRQKAAHLIVGLINGLPPELHKKILNWLYKYASHERASHRMLALEIFSKQLHKTADPFLLAALLARIRDTSSTVRAKAIAILAEMTYSTLSHLRSLLHTIFVEPYEHCQTVDDYEGEQLGFLRYEAILQALNDEESTMDPLPSGLKIIQEILEFTKDEKVYVRKASLQVIENIMKLSQKWMVPRFIEVLCRHTLDPALMIRKMIVSSLTELVRSYPDNYELATNWVRNVLPLLSDTESKVQEKVAECFEDLVIKQIRRQNTGHSFHLAWTIIELLIDAKLNKFLRMACIHWSEGNNLGGQLENIVRGEIGGKFDGAAWYLLACMSENIQLKDVDYVVSFYKTIDKSNITDNQIHSHRSILEILGNCCTFIAPCDRIELIDDISQRLRIFDIRAELIGPTLDLLTHLSQEHFKGREKIETISEELVHLCESNLEMWINSTPRQPDQPPPEDLIRALVTLGDAVQLCKGKLNFENYLKLDKCLFPDEGTSKAKGLWANNDIQAAAFITLGKMCLLNEDVAKRAISGLGMLLGRTKIPSVKINCMCALSDLCIRYTTLVEPFVPTMAAGLKDKSHRVRKQTLILLVQLTQEDFLRLRGSLFFTLLAMIRDKSNDIAEMTRFFFADRLIPKNPQIMFQNLIAALSFYNDLKDHDFALEPLCSQPDIEIEFVALEQEDRHSIYRYMLEHMDDALKFKSTHRICTNIFERVLDGKLSLDTVAGKSTLKDALFCLGSEEIKCSSLRSKSDEEDPADDDERVIQIVENAKKQIINECVKKNVIENIVPLIMEIKKKLEEMRSPLHIDLMHFLKELVKDYKNELKDIFENDKQLATEMLYDIKRFEEQQKELEKEREKEKEKERDHERNRDRENNRARERQKNNHHMEHERIEEGNNVQENELLNDQEIKKEQEEEEQNRSIENNSKRDSSSSNSKENSSKRDSSSSNSKENSSRQDSSSSNSKELRSRQDSSSSNSKENSSRQDSSSSNSKENSSKLSSSNRKKNSSKPSSSNRRENRSKRGEPSTLSGNENSSQPESSNRRENRSKRGEPSTLSGNENSSQPESSPSNSSTETSSTSSKKGVKLKRKRTNS